MQPQFTSTSPNGQPDRAALPNAAQIRSVCRCSNPSCECHAATGHLHCPAHDDTKPALSVDERDGRTLWKCHAGCPQEAVTRAILGRTAQHKPRTPEQRQSAGNRQETASSTKKAARLDWNGPQTVVSRYHDEADNVLFEVARTGTGDAKQISQRRPDGRGGYVYSLGDTRRVLYRLPEVLAAQSVFICEGEKAADATRAALEEAGLLGEFASSTNPHGAGKWRDGFSEALTGKRVFILPDNDAPGRNHAQTVARSVAPFALETRVVGLQGLPEKGDTADFFHNAGHVAELLEIAEAAPLWEPTAPDAAPDEAKEPTAPRPRFVFVGAQQVKAQKPPRALIAGLLFENTGAELCGGQATFKSFTALAMADAVASGAGWHGHETQQAPTAYITGEGSAAIGKRIRALEIYTRRSCEVQFLLEAVQLHRPEEVEALLLAVAQLPEKPGLIIVDTLARCFVGGDENSARDAGLFVAGVDRIRAATGATVLILHHLSKSGDTRGSTAFAGAFDTIIEARRENTTVTLRCTKQKDAPDFEAVTLARRVVELDEIGEDGHPLTSLVFEATDAPPATATHKAEQTREQVFCALQSAPEGLTATKWLEASKLSESRFYTHRDALVKAGRVTQNGRIYQVTPFTPFTPFPSEKEH